MGDRRQARELALQTLFYFDMHDQNPEDMLDQFCSNFEDQLTETVKPFFMELVQGVVSNKLRIDNLLETCSKNWKLSRMPAVDRNIMRIATFEFLEKPDIPVSVSINEAVEIGKKFGTEESSAFINGVLDRIHCLENIDLKK